MLHTVSPTLSMALLCGLLSIHQATSGRQNGRIIMRRLEFLSVLTTGNGMLVCSQTGCPFFHRCFLASVCKAEMLNKQLRAFHAVSSGSPPAMRKFPLALGAAGQPTSRFQRH